MRAILVALVLALAMPAVAFRPTITAGGATAGAGGGGGGGSTTLDDDFEADATGWSRISGDWCRKQTGDGVLEHVGPGVCQYDDATGNAGTNPTSGDSWVVMEYAAAFARTGPHLRMTPTTPGATDYSVAVEWESDGQITFANCNSGTTCDQVSLNNAGVDSSAPAIGDQIGMVASGSGSSTEVCVWQWRAATADPTWDDPTTWGDAQACISVAGTMTALAAFSDCGGTTVCDAVTWTYGAPNGTGAGSVNFNTNNVEWEWILAGDL